MASGTIKAINPISVDHAAESNAITDFATPFNNLGSLQNGDPLSFDCFAKNATDSPHPSNDGLVVTYRSSTYGWQVSNSDSGMDKRVCQAGTWGAWTEIPTFVIAYTWTPTIAYTGGGAPTVSNVQTVCRRYGKIVFLNCRFNLTNLNSPGASSHLCFTMPSGMKADNWGNIGFGMYFLNTSLSAFTVRQGNDDDHINICYGAGGGYSAPQLNTGYQGFFCIAPLK